MVFSQEQFQQAMNELEALILEVPDVEDALESEIYLLEEAQAEGLDARGNEQGMREARARFKGLKDSVTQKIVQLRENLTQMLKSANSEEEKKIVHQSRAEFDELMSNNPMGRINPNLLYKSNFKSNIPTKKSQIPRKPAEPIPKAALIAQTLRPTVQPRKLQQPSRLPTAPTQSRIARPSQQRPATQPASNQIQRPTLMRPPLGKMPVPSVLPAKKSIAMRSPQIPQRPATPVRLIPKLTPVRAQPRSGRKQIAISSSEESLHPPRRQPKPKTPRSLPPSSIGHVLDKPILHLRRVENNLDGPGTSKPQRPIIPPPFIYTEGAVVPDNLIERDAFYCALQLIGKDEKDHPLLNSPLMKKVESIAKNWLISPCYISALEMIGREIRTTRCFPLEFFNNFLYHPNNPCFATLKIDDQTMNQQIRTDAIRNRGFLVCREGEHPDRTYDSKKSILQIEELLTRSGIDVSDYDEVDKMSTIEENSEVSIAGIEKSNTSEEMMPIPLKIHGKLSHNIVTSNEQKSYLSNSPIPQLNVATATIEAEMALLDNRLQQQIAEGDEHLNKSHIHGQGIRYVLHPTALERHNFWQPRGSNTPNWFPGFYTVFPNSFDYRPTAHHKTEEALFHAYQTMAPSRS